MINTVGELISALSKYPKDMKVYSNHITRNLAGQIIIDHENSPEEEAMERRLEEYKTPLPKEDNHLTRIVYAYVNGKISDEELIKSIKEMPDEYPYDKNDIKPFSLEAAKAGKPVCTRDGRKARIACFDAKFPKTGNIVTLVEEENGEEVILYHYDDGHCSIGRDYDLMMFPEKKEGYVNIYKTCYGYEIGNFCSSKEKAEKVKETDCIATVKIEWKE